MTDARGLRTGLDEVAAHGAPAQREAAARLIAHWDDGAPDPEAARALIDAYRHDPYLWR